jgi:hypothetical protein
MKDSSLEIGLKAAFLSNESRTDIANCTEILGDLDGRIAGGTEDGEALLEQRTLFAGHLRVSETAHKMQLVIAGYYLGRERPGNDSLFSTDHMPKEI